MNAGMNIETWNCLECFGDGIIGYCMTESSEGKAGDMSDDKFEAKDNFVQILSLLKFLLDTEWSEVDHDQGIILNEGMTLETFQREL